jgi:hypothetical protein
LPSRSDIDRLTNFFFTHPVAKNFAVVLMNHCRFLSIVADIRSWWMAGTDMIAQGVEAVGLKCPPVDSWAKMTHRPR